jgi:lipopolysaccharide transport system ATP-binding protein
MSNIAIRAEDLSKRYRIGTRKIRHDTLREHLVDGLKSIFLRDTAQAERATIWALKNVSFEVTAGETVGIIGRNGSGKSTLLKILTRITEPTSGRAVMYGRTGSLLEVGTGFDRDLTGRENIYLNGAVLGMRKAEIDRKFDEIVAFSEIERFMDTPVKRYSSGMYVRLAFAVAAHLEPEILLVDEVLAVGDAAFQKKCLAKMRDIGQAGRTILFVSHNMSAVTRLCPRAVLLEKGGVLADGPSPTVVSSYLASYSRIPASQTWDTEGGTVAPQGRATRLVGIRVRVAGGKVTDTVNIRDPIEIDIEYDVYENAHLLMPAFHVFNEEGTHLFSAREVNSPWHCRRRPPGRYISTVRLPGDFLSEGMHFVGIGMYRLEPAGVEFELEQAVAFRVLEGIEPGRARGNLRGELRGLVRPLFQWATHYTPKPSEQLGIIAADPET